MARAAKREAANGRGLVNLRISIEDRNVIDRAARTAGKTRTQFMLEAARRAAHEMLLDTTLILADRETFARLKAQFDAPAKPNKRLRTLMKLKAPWDS
jgi:uncharacterized protein (DUF1778 family)